MRLSCYITAVMVWVGMVVALMAFSSSHHRTQDVFVILFVVAGIVSSVLALVLAFFRREVAVGFGAFGILHGLTLPFLFWPATPQSPGLALIVPALAVCIGLRAVMMTRKRT